MTTLAQPLDATGGSPCGTPGGSPHGAPKGSSYGNPEGNPYGTQEPGAVETPLTAMLAHFTLLEPVGRTVRLTPAAHTLLEAGMSPGE